MRPSILCLDDWPGILQLKNQGPSSCAFVRHLPKSNEQAIPGYLLEKETGRVRHGEVSHQLSLRDGYVNISDHTTRAVGRRWCIGKDRSRAVGYELGAPSLARLII